MAETLVNDARVMSKGQVTIPKNIRAALGVTTGDRVTFIADGNSVRNVERTLSFNKCKEAGGNAEEDA